MKVLECEPSFLGFLSAAHRALVPGGPAGAITKVRRAVRRAAPDGGRSPSRLPAELPAPFLPFDDAEPVPVDEGPARELWDALRAKISGDPLRRVHEAWLSELPGIEDALVVYMGAALAEGLAIERRLAEPAFLAVEKAARRARMEAHRFLGLVRFAELRDGSLYAEIEPECAVLPLLAEHFSERFPALRWVIRDLARDEALFHEAGQKAIKVDGLRLGLPAAMLGEGPSFDDGPRKPPGPGVEADPRALWAEGEARVQAAWKVYFSRVSILERKNPRLQGAHMPKKHWNHLPEMEGRA